MNTLESRDSVQHEAPFGVALAFKDHLDRTLYEGQMTDARALAAHMLGRSLSRSELITITPFIVQELHDQHPALADDPDFQVPRYFDDQPLPQWVESTLERADDYLDIGPMSNPERLGDIEVAFANKEVWRSVVSTARSFHFEHYTSDGRLLHVPVPYQIAEPGFRPAKAAKGSAEFNRAILDEAIAAAEQQGIDLGLESEEALTKLMIQLGIGIDCSNFAYRIADDACERLGIGSYADHVFKSTDQVLDLYEGGKWPAKDSAGNDRQLTPDELAMLNDLDHVPISWVCETFGKDPEHITPAANMCDDEATEVIEVDEVMAGDVVSFENPSLERVSHLAVIEGTDKSNGGDVVSFWHSWHTRGFDGGLRRDGLFLGPGRAIVGATHERLVNPSSYTNIQFRRPKAYAKHYRDLRAQFAA